jgi:uncharacterized protein (TIGR03067 family)
MGNELQGAWVVVAGEREGQPADILQDLGFRDGRFVFEGDRVTLHTGGLQRVGTVATYPGTAPQAIDIHLEGGAGKLLLGIYTVRGDRITLCLATDGGRRPETFATQLGSSQVLFILERVANGAQPSTPQRRPLDSSPFPPDEPILTVLPARRSFLSVVPWRWSDLLIGLLPVVAVGGALLLLDPYWVFAHAPWLRWLLMLLGTAWLLVYPLWVARRRHAPRPRLPGLRAVAIELALAIPLLLGVWLALAILFIAWALLVGAAEPTRSPLEPVVRSPNWVGTLFIILMAVGIGPLAEEVFCRGMLYNALRQRLPLAVALVLQAVLFGAAHSFSVEYAVVAGLLGLALAGVYQWRKTLLAPVLLHSLYNGAALGLAVLAVAVNPDPAVLGVYGDRQEGGFQIRGVVPGSGAEAAGLRVGDVITAVDGQPVADIRGLRGVVRRKQVGDRVRVEFLRNGELHQTEATLKRLPR